ncbi:MAG: hypothetical protein V7K38_17735 [Nostoc sp.]|uniref:hypothetical protein n=1 Tax=Nostoc sp. TaxID=1180 RepID=UPI002FF80DA3
MPKQPKVGQFIKKLHKLLGLTQKKFTASIVRSERFIAHSIYQDYSPNYKLYIST